MATVNTCAEHKMTKLSSSVFTFLLLLLVGMSFSVAQDLDVATRNKLKVKFMLAQEYYEKGEFINVLSNVEEIEALLNGIEYASVQTLKVKSLIALERYLQAQQELEKLYGMNVPVEILRELSTYESTIKAGVEVVQTELAGCEDHKSCYRSGYETAYEEIALKRGYYSKACDLYTGKKADCTTAVYSDNDPVANAAWEYLETMARYHELQRIQLEVREEDESIADGYAQAQQMLSSPKLAYFSGAPFEQWEGMLVAGVTDIKRKVDVCNEKSSQRKRDKCMVPVQVEIESISAADEQYAAMQRVAMSVKMYEAFREENLKTAAPLCGALNNTFMAPEAQAICGPNPDGTK
jgi:hypothetical protein